MQTKKIIQVEDKVPPRLLVPLSIQHMFAMFGASVLVPFMLGISPAIVLFMNGIGTLLFILITKGKAPAYLGSSFAFIAPASMVIEQWGYEYALGGFVVVGAIGCILAAIIYKCGTNWINVVLPPAAMGPVVALIGLELAGSAASTGQIVGDSVTTSSVITFCVTLGVAVLGSVLFRKFLSVIPILIAILCGYAAGLITEAFSGEHVIRDGITAALQQPLFQLPNFQTPKFDLEAILIILPVILVIANEHIGHQLVTSKVVGRDLLKDPGLHRSLFADNFSTMLSGLIGSVPTTTYGENIGVMAITRVYSVRVIGGAAVLSIICSFVGPLAALIQTIPGPVIGGISFLLYGMIGTSGLRILVDNKVDYSKNRNMVLTSVVFVVGLSGVTLSLGNVALSGMTLAAIVAMLMSLLFFAFDKLGWSNDLQDE
nr:uracil permease [uncultured Agathobaculum sp.]